MKPARMLMPLALAAALAAPLAATATRVEAAPRKPSAASPATARKAAAFRQFTGVVTSFDKTSITVEKGGKAPKTMVFARHADLRTTGDLAKDARVTVYWRDEDGHPVAHRVVVKAAPVADATP